MSRCEDYPCCGHGTDQWGNPDCPDSQGLFLFLVPAGARAFIFINDVLIRLLDSSAAGARFHFGRRALPPGATGEQGETPLGFILAFQALPTIVFFSALMSILYHCNILPRIIRGFAWLFTRLMKVSGAESLCTASNIFVGVESALVIKPHLARMTRSELAVVLTSGMATVASNVLALYIFSLQKIFPMIAGHLVSASIIAAPCALVMSKIIVPEREAPATRHPPRQVGESGQRREGERGGRPRHRPVQGVGARHQPVLPRLQGHPVGEDAAVQGAGRAGVTAGVEGR